MIRDIDEVIICSAIRLPSDYIVRGHRHNDCFRTMLGMERGKGLYTTDVEQGFMTSGNRFVGRREAYAIHYKCPIEMVGSRELYSEDVY